MKKAEKEDRKALKRDETADVTFLIGIGYIFIIIVTLLQNFLQI